MFFRHIDTSKMPCHNFNCCQTVVVFMLQLSDAFLGRLQKHVLQNSPHPLAKHPPSCAALFDSLLEFGTVFLPQLLPQ